MLWRKTDDLHPHPHPQVQNSRFLITAALGLAMALTFGCSSDKDDGENDGGDTQSECTANIRDQINTFRDQIREACIETYQGELVETCVSAWEEKAKEEVEVKQLYDKCPNI